MASVGDVIVKNPNILHGTPVFRGTRSPFRLSWTTSITCPVMSANPLDTLG